MKRIVLSTSTSCISHVHTPHNIRIIPLHIIVDGKDHLDGRDIDTATLSKMLYNNPRTIARSSEPTVAEVENIFDELYAYGYEEVLVCSVSSSISKCHETFEKVKSKFVGKMNIYIYDTKTINIDEGALAFEADLMMQEGKSLLEIIKRLDELRAHSVFMLSLSDLTALVRNKKLSAPASMIANLFSIKPVLWMNDDGYIVVKDKVRKFERVMYHMADIITHQMGGRDAFVYIVDTSIGLHTNEFKNILAHDYGLRNVPVIPVSTVSLANHGPTGVGLGVYYGEVPRIFKYLK